MEQDSYHTQTETAQYKDVDLSALTPDEFKAKIREWRQDPVLYFIERLGINCSLGDTYEPGDEMDIHEKRLLRVLPEAIVLRKPIVVPSANAMGKDWAISGRASLWFFECFGPCKVIQTATGERQVLDIMWNELRSAYNARPSQDSMGKMTTGKLEVNEDWFITAFTTKE